MHVVLERVCPRRQFDMSEMFVVVSAWLFCLGAGAAAE